MLCGEELHFVWHCFAVVYLQQCPSAPTAETQFFSMVPSRVFPSWLSGNKIQRITPAHLLSVTFAGGEKQKQNLIPPSALRWTSQMDSYCDVISFALRAETSCQNNADKNFISSCFVFRCGRNRADKYERQYFHHVGCREHLERGTVKQVISKWLELTSFVFTKTRARKEHDFTPATSDWRWGKCHWELHTAASFHLFTYLFFYIFVSQTSKKRFDTRACARHVEPFSARQTSPKIPAVTTRLQRAAQCNFPQHRLSFWKALHDRLFNTVYLALCVEPPVKACFFLKSFCQNRRCVWPSHVCVIVAALMGG